MSLCPGISRLRPVDPNQRFLFSLCHPLVMKEGSLFRLFYQGVYLLVFCSSLCGAEDVLSVSSTFKSVLLCVAQGPVALISPESLGAMNVLRPHTKPTEPGAQESVLPRAPGDSYAE